MTLDSFEPANVRLGFSGVGTCDVRCERGMWQVSGNVRFGKDVALGQGSRISVGCDGDLSIGAGFRMTARSSIICHQKAEFGEGVLISWDNLIMDTDSHQIDDGKVSAPIHVGDHVWIGCRCLVLKGADIPEGSVLAAGATVTKRLPSPNALYGGVNKQIRDGVSWHE